MPHPARACATVVGALGLALLAWPASAHVSVDPDEAEQGGYATLSFRVPNESDTATTTAVEIALPSELTSASVRPHPGWTYRLTRSGDKVTAITWTAAGPGGIRPGEFDEFDLAVGPLPETDRVVFKALQTYSDGSVARWIEVPKAGQPEPEHPAPVLTLTAAGSGADAAAAASTDDSEEDGDSRVPLVLSIVALAVALGAAATALARRRG